MIFVWMNTIAVLISAAICTAVLARVGCFLVHRLSPSGVSPVTFGLAPAISLIGFVMVTASPNLLILAMLATAIWCAPAELRGQSAPAPAAAHLALVVLITASLMAPLLGAPWHTALDAALVVSCMGGFFAVRKRIHADLGVCFVLPALLLLICGLALFVYQLIGGAL